MDAPHEVLGVDTDADEDEVVAAYRERVKDAHPDHGGSEAQFHRVRAAYEALRDGDARREQVAEPDAAERDGDADGEPPRETASTVEYLDYAAVTDSGWSLDDGDLFERAARADLGPRDHGRLTVGPDETLLEAAEDAGLTWPFACRGGACANCAVAMVEGDLSLPTDHILPPEQIDRGIRLSCIGTPTTETAKVVFNVKHLPDLDDLRLPPGPFERAQADD